MSAALAFVERVGAANLDLAPSVAYLLSEQARVSEMNGPLSRRVGMWLAAAPEKDMWGRLWNVHAPLHAAEPAKAWADIIRQCPDAPVVLEGDYKSHDEEYLDARVLQDAFGSDPTAEGPSLQSLGDG